MLYLKRFLCLSLLCISCCGSSIAQTVSTIAGTGISGTSGDGGPATDATIGVIYGLYVDASRNIYAGDATTERLRKITPSGIITTIGGGGTGVGDGMPATDAMLANPCSITMDPAGNLYIADAANNRVRIIAPTGIINTFAGGGIPPTGVGDGGPATAAILNSPAGVARDGAGNYYIADMEAHRVRKVSPSGIITTIAGTGVLGYSGDGGAATAALVARPYGMAVDAAGNVYFSDINYHTIRVIAPSGIISTLAGMPGVASFTGDGGPATAATFAQPYNIVLDATGNLFVADQGNYRIRKINTSGIISTYAFNGATTYSGDGGLAILAGASQIWGLAVDNSNNLYVGEYSHRIRYITDTLQMGAVQGLGILCAGSTVTLTDTTAGGTWSSGNVAIATAGSATGAITGISAGQAIISYTKSGISMIDTITVQPLPAPGSITGDTTVCPGFSITLADTATTGSWTSANSLATVSGVGDVTAGSTPGLDTIYYAVTNSCGSATVLHRVKVLTTSQCALQATAPVQLQPGLKVFPNPTNGACSLLFTAPQSAEPATIIITDCLGQKVRQFTTSNNVSASIILPASGTYFISATYGAEHYWQTVTVVKE